MKVILIVLTLIVAGGCADPRPSTPAPGHQVRQAFPATAVAQGFTCEPPNFVKFVEVCGQGGQNLIVRIQCDPEAKALTYGVAMGRQEPGRPCL
jgi:hypothetical protein